MGAIYDTLMRIDPATKTFVPQLAESMTSNADGSEFTLKLRPNVKFSDGTDYDADAVVFGLKRHVQYGSALAGQVSSIKEYTVVDKLTVKFTLTASVAELSLRAVRRAGHDSVADGDQGGVSRSDQAGP